MRNIIFAIVLLQLSTQLAAENENTAQLEDQARNLAAQLGMQLKARLQNAMQTGGPASAISTCNVSAPEIADELSTGGWTVGRTSLKLRNPGNSPDEWERSTLLAFEQQLASGIPAAGLQNSVIETDDGVTRYRYMKAIPIDTVCMACHGETISDDVKSVLTEKYPLDAATGYKPGQLRGAFTVSKILTDNEAD
ncbi:MAG: DUF3365 domain-containing protein [Burkholderiales bacterium]|nr:DUF3365 domain-containing protein [Burkholderiales bacterium]MDR4517423.1 DUF3365 domain-containing protein [Nitrosomonas sp.]